MEASRNRSLASIQSSGVPERPIGLMKLLTTLTAALILGSGIAPARVLFECRTMLTVHTAPCDGCGESAVPTCCSLTAEPSGSVSVVSEKLATLSAQNTCCINVYQSPLLTTADRTEETRAYDNQSITDEYLLSGASFVYADLPLANDSVSDALSPPIGSPPIYLDYCVFRC